MMLVISTQHLENYGAHDWDGRGECPQYWKAKGGCDYKVPDMPEDIDCEQFVNSIKFSNSEYFREYVIGWCWKEDGWLSDFERDQLEYEGRIAFPEPVLKYDVLCREDTVVG